MGRGNRHKASLRTNHIVAHCTEDKRQENLERDFSDGLGQEIDPRLVHSVVVVAKEDRLLLGKHLRARKNNKAGKKGNGEE